MLTNVSPAMCVRRLLFSQRVNLTNQGVTVATADVPGVTKATLSPLPVNAP